MLGVGLRKLFPLDSFGYLYENRPPEGAKPSPRGVQNGLREASGRLFCASWAQLRRQGRSEAVFGRLWGRSWGALGGSWGCLEASWASPGASRAAPGRSWGWFWDLPGADLDDLDDVCGAT